MWANAQRDGRPAEYRWRPLFNAAKFGWRPLLECRAVTLPKWESAKLGRKMNVAPGKIPSRGKNPWKCIYSVPGQVTAKHRAKFGWLPLSDVATVTLPGRESREISWGAPNYRTDLSRCGLKFNILWGHVAEILLLNNFFPIFDTCLSCKDIARQSCGMCPDGDFLWSPYGIGQTIIFLLCGFFFLLCSFLFLLSSSFFFSSPNLSGRRLDVCHASTHGVALVRI